MLKQKFDYDLIVIGSGAGGSVAATVANAGGKKVAIVEAGRMGGECPNYGCIPTKAMIHVAEAYQNAKKASDKGLRSNIMGYNYPSIRAWKERVVRRTGAAQSEHYYENLGIDVIKGQAHFLTPYEITVNRQHYTARHFVIATGTKTFVPPIDGLDGVPFLTNVEALELNRPPKSIFIVGGGAIGCEFAQLFATFGTKVHMIDIAPRLLFHEDAEVSDFIAEVFRKEYGMNIVLDAKVISVEREGIARRVRYRVGEDIHSVRVDELMIASGKQAVVDFGLENAGIEYTPRSIIVNERMQTSASHIYAVGDVAGPYMFTHMAIYQGRIAANNLLNPKKRHTVDYHAVPRCIFVNPEVASVGLTEEECLKYAIDFKKATAPLGIITRSNVADTRDGFAKVITNRQGVIIGASVVAPHAGEIIHELTLAVRLGLKASDLAETLHAFPTWSEIVRVACAKVSK